MATATRETGRTEGTVACSMFLYMLSFCLLIPVYPKLLLQLCNQDTARAAAVYGLLMGVRNLLECFSAPLLGACSDRPRLAWLPAAVGGGRRVMLCLAFAVSSVEYSAMAIAPAVSTAFTMRVLSGALDGALPIAYAMLTDMSRSRNVSVAVTYGILGVVFGIAFIVGPSLGAALMTVSLTVPFIVSAVLSMLAVLLIVAIVPDTQARAEGHVLGTETEPLSWSHANPVPILREFLSNAMLARMTTPFILGYIPTGIFYVWYLFLEYRYHWHHMLIGTFLSFSGALLVLVQGPTLHYLVPHYWSEESAVRVGLGCSAVAFLLFAVNPSGVMIFAIAVGTCLSALYEPAMRAVVVKVAGEDAADWQGVLQGSIASIRTLSMACAAPLFGSLFAYSVSVECEKRWGSTMPELVFYVGAIFYLLALITVRPILCVTEESIAIPASRTSVVASVAPAGPSDHSALSMFGAQFVELKLRRLEQVEELREFQQDDDEQMEGLLNAREQEADDASREVMEQNEPVEIGL